MLPKQLRLPASERASQTNKKNTPFFTLLSWKNTVGHNRYGFVVSKKIDKRAVVRNRLKRVLRSVIEEMHEDLPKGQDMLFIIKINFTEEKREIVKKIIEGVLL